MDSEDKQQLTSVLQAMQTLREVYSDMTLSQAAGFLLVCLHPGQTVSALRGKMEVKSLSVASRVLSTIGEGQQEGRGGLGLVELQSSRKDRRQKRAYPTERGRELLARIIDAPPRIDPVSEKISAEIA